MRREYSRARSETLNTLHRSLSRGQAGVKPGTEGEGCHFWILIQIHTEKVCLQYKYTVSSSTICDAVMRNPICQRFSCFHSIVHSAAWHCSPLVIISKFHKTPGPLAALTLTPVHSVMSPSQPIRGHMEGKWPIRRQESVTSCPLPTNSDIGLTPYTWHSLLSVKTSAAL